MTSGATRLGSVSLVSKSARRRASHARRLEMREFQQRAMARDNQDSMAEDALREQEEEETAAAAMVDG